MLRGGIRPLNSAKIIMIKGYSSLKAIGRIGEMNKVIIFLLIMAVLLLGCHLYKQLQVKDGFTKIKVGNTAVKVMVRDTVEGRSQGLSGVEKLKEDEGRLFVFPVLSKYSFWMKGMKFDLDFVWIKDNKVVEITEGVKASREGEAVVRVQPEMGVNRVLEVNSGFVKENEIKVGDMIQLGL